MKQGKKIFTRMCLNNWGGIDHQILQFHEYVNLFSGKSGSGKSTVMDAIQVILYGSFSPGFLNKAADDAKNRRSVLSYLRGEQKDGTANREGQDFCSEIVLEIEDVGTHAVTCVGIAFEVRKNDSELKKYLYFSHSGQMPENGYLTEGGFPYSNPDIRRLIDERAKKEGRSDVNRVYYSKEAYLNSLYDGILGYIDGSRFITMEKSAIALKMTNGTGQFIRDYMFPKSESDTIETISEQLGAYRDIREKIDVLKNKIDLLSAIKEAGCRLVSTRSDIVRAQATVRCIDIEDLKHKIRAIEEDIVREKTELETLFQEEKALEEAAGKAENEFIAVSADLKASDLGSRQEQLKELERHCEMLSGDTAQWLQIVSGLKRWETDEVITDYVSNRLLQLIHDFEKGNVSEEQCRQLHNRIEEEKKNIEEEFDEYNERQKALTKELSEKKRLVDDMKNNRKSYPESLRQARAALEDRLSRAYGRTVHVQIFADLFDVTQEEWKNAIEGRLGRLKLSLITEPAYAHDAARLFREMKQFEEVNLINSAAAAKSEPKAAPGSLYEAVAAKEAYVDVCLKRYLGYIIKCRDIGELEQVRDGVTADCYSYSNFIFRHLREKDYTRYACIGSRVSRAKLSEYEEDVERLSEELSGVKEMAARIKAARNFESLSAEPAYLIRLSGAGAELSRVQKERDALKESIRALREGQYRELEEKEARLKKEKEEIRQKEREKRELVRQKELRLEHLAAELEARKEELSEKALGYIPNADIEAEVEQAMQSRSGQAVKNAQNAKITALQEKEQAETENLQNARNAYIFAYPSSGFSGVEKSNEAYENLLASYLQDYEPKYQEEFVRQCDLIYKSLRDNVIATIHGDIKAAKRHTGEINRLLKETNFSDSTYQIKIEPAKNENGQFFDMLMASELDSKTTDNGGFEGQMSLGEDIFYQKYEEKIRLLTDKFMPPREGDERSIEARRKEMEQYADYRSYLSFSMYEQVTDESGRVIRENFVDEMAGRDSGGEGQNPKYVALLAGFAMLYRNKTMRDSKIRLVLLDEAFSKMDQERSAVCLSYARKMDLQLIVCVPDERLQSLIRNVDCVYGFRRHNNRISMMHIDKGDYLQLMEGER